MVEADELREMRLPTAFASSCALKEWVSRSSSRDDQHPIWSKAVRQVAPMRGRLDAEGKDLYDSRLDTFQNKLRSADAGGNDAEGVAEKTSRPSMARAPVSGRPWGRDDLEAASADPGRNLRPSRRHEGRLRLRRLA
jgi:hypothetical protein